MINLDITDEEKKALRIDYVNESYFRIHSKCRTIELTKHSDGDTEFEITDGNDRMTYVLDKAQIEFLTKWLNHSK